MAALAADAELDRLCRTCLAKDETMRHLWGQEAQQACLVAMIGSLTELKMKEGDGLPINICYKCFDSVTNAFLFKLQAEKADAKLRLYISSKTSTIKQENHDLDIKIEDGLNFNLETDCLQSDIDEDHFDDSDSKPLIDLKNSSPLPSFSESINSDLGDNIGENSKAGKKKFDKILLCKLCDKTFKYISCLKKHLQSHLTHEPFSTINAKSKTQFVKNYQQIEGTNSVNLSEDYVMKLMIEDIKNEKYDQYIGEVDPISKDVNIKKIEEPPVTDAPLKTLSTIKKKKIINLKAKIKHGIKRIRRNKVHKCSICQRMFSRSNHLIRHMSTHNFDYPDKCQICNKVFPNKEMLFKHNKVQCERIDQPFRCGICDLMFSDKTIYTNHMLKKHNGITTNFIPLEDIIADKLDQYMTEFSVDITAENLEPKIYACGGCEMRFEDENSFNDHAVEFHNGENVGLNFIDPQNIKMEKLEDIEDPNIEALQSMEIGEEAMIPAMDDGSSGIDFKFPIMKPKKRVRNDRFYQCSLCSRVFSRSNHLMRHMSIHNFQYPDVCKICNKVFPNKEMLLKHSFVRCEKVLRRFQCGSCNSQFENEALVTEHLSKEHPGETVSVKVVEPHCQMRDRYICDICDKGFHRKDHLEKHLKFHNKNERRFQCQICSRKFKEEANLISHSVVHQLKRGPDSKFHCSYCKNAFSHPSNLVVHLRRHTGEKPFKCDICSKGFPRSSDLMCHRRTHTGEKPSLCNICGKGFSRSTKLVRHMRIHTGLRPYKCKHCDRAFTQSNDLTLHTRRHTGDRPYICDICGERFINGTALQTHRKSRGHFRSGNESTQIASPVPHNVEESQDAEKSSWTDTTIKHED